MKTAHADRILRFTILSSARWTCPNARLPYPIPKTSIGYERQNFLHFYYFFITHKQREVGCRMAASRRDCATRRGGHCVTNTGSGFSCVISTITNREYAGDQWSPVFYCFVGNHRSGYRSNRTGRRVSSSPKRSPCRLSPGAPAARRCRSRAHAACTRPRWSCRRGSTPRS